MSILITVCKMPQSYTSFLLLEGAIGVSLVVIAFFLSDEYWYRVRLAMETEDQAVILNIKDVVDRWLEERERILGIVGKKEKEKKGSQ